MAGRFNLDRDLVFFESISRELVDSVVETTVVLFKLIIAQTKVNIYGESKSKTYNTGVQCTSIIDRGDTNATYAGMGSDTSQIVTFKFNRFTLKANGFYPEIGDMIYHNDAYFEIDNVSEDQLIGGQYGNKFSIICTTFMTRISNLQIEQRRI